MYIYRKRIERITKSPTLLKFILNTKTSVTRRLRKFLYPDQLQYSERAHWTVTGLCLGIIVFLPDGKMNLGWIHRLIILLFRRLRAPTVTGDKYELLQCQWTFKDNSNEMQGVWRNPAFPPQIPPSQSQNF